jgi:hypothetical protein
MNEMKQEMHTHIKDEFYLRLNHGGYRRKPKYELRSIHSEGLGSLFASFGEEHKEYAEFILDACNSYRALIAENKRLHSCLGHVRESMQCECSTAERDSGHLVGCWLPEAIQEIDALLTKCGVKVND